MASDDLPDRIPKSKRRSVADFFVDNLFGETNPIILGLEHGVAGVVLGTAIWLVFGLIWLAFIVGGLTFYGLQRKGHR